MKQELIVQLGLISLEAAACIAGFVNWHKIRRSYWKWFPIYLLLIAAVELTGVYLAHVMKDIETNNDLYNYFGIPVQLFFFFWLIAQYLRPYEQSKWPLYGAAIYLFSLIIDIGWLIKDRFWFHSLSYTVGNVVLLVLILLCFIKIIKSEEILRYRSSLMFWVSLGLLVFYLGSFPFYALRNTLLNEYREVFDAYKYVAIGLCYLMYIFFILAFIWAKPK